MAAPVQARSWHGRLGAAAAPSLVRVAVYTRKSTSEGLDQELNSLEAQRQSVEAYIQSQRAHGWKALADRYDDGGFTGANTQRPSFQRLLTDIEAGKVDCVAVYKIDRLSRSLSDFAGIMERFERHGVTFVSVTQQFSTATSVGKLTLNLLMSFAEFERDVISERTRDKISACRRKGLWTGGRPVLGYDVLDKKLLVNEAEAARVRKIYALYLEHGSLLETVRELGRRQVQTKTFRSRSGRLSPGGPFTKISLQALLTNPLYAGMVRAGNGLAEGAHAAVVAKTTWDAVQERLQHNRRCGRGPRRRWHAPLEGLLRCGACGKPMGHHFSVRSKRSFRYYVCQTQQKLGAKACPGSRVSAAAVEEHVFGQVERAAREHGLLEAAMAVDSRRASVPKDSLRRDTLGNGTAHGNGIANGSGIGNGMASTTSVRPGWPQLGPDEQKQILRTLIAGVLYTAADDEVEIELRRTSNGREDGAV